MAQKLYTEEYIADIAESLRLKADENGETYTTAEMADAVLNLGYTNIPTHHYTEAYSVIDEIISFKKTSTNNFIIGAVSDNHIYANDATYEANSKASIRHGAFALETISALVGADFIINLGDNCWENGIDTDNAFEGASYTVNALKGAFAKVPSFAIAGNHDRCDNTAKLHSLVSAGNPYTVSASTAVRGFGYTDFASKKVRAIFLNSVDYLNASGGYGMSYEQKDFLIRALDLSSKSDASSWQILLLSHIPLDFAGGDYNTGADIKEILDAYASGGAVEIDVFSNYSLNENPRTYSTFSTTVAPKDSSAIGVLYYSYNNKNKAKIIANIHGHIHTNAYGTMADNGIARMATPNSCFYLNKTEAYTDKGDYSITSTEAAKLVKTANTAKDTSVTFYCIDLTEQMIYAFGYGANTNRTMSYKDIVRYTITNNLTYSTNSNTASYVEENGSYTATITANAGYELSSVKVTMGGTDITSTAYSNGKITITKATGNIVITAVSVEEVKYNNLFDESAVQNNTRFSSSGGITSGSFWCMSTFIPVSAGDTIRILLPSGDWSGHSQRVIATYTSAAESSHVGKDLYVSACTVSGKLLTGVVPATVSHIRISGIGAYAGTVITKNEEIV